MFQKSHLALFPFALICVALFSTASAAAAGPCTLQFGEAACTYDPASRVLDCRLGERTLRIAAPAPGPEDAAWTLERIEQGRGSWTAYYAASSGDKHSLTLTADKDSLLLRVQGAGRGVAAATLLGDGPWRRVDVSQYGVAHGQARYQKATYVDGLWVWAFWRLEAGNCSAWNQRRRENSGAGPLELAPQAVYTPNTAGDALPIDETLEVRIARGLWDAVPESANAPSAFREELAGCVFLDWWSSTPVSEVAHALRALDRIAGERVRFYTVLQNWQAGGFDALLPDSIRMPDYPPNPCVGTPQELAELAAQGRKMGFFGFRTNYQFLREGAPSRLEGKATPALDPKGEPKWHTKPSQLAALARRQEAEIQALFHPNATFTDQLASGGPASSYVDYDAAIPGANCMRETVRLQREFAEILHEAHGGPLGSESLNAEYLLGRWVDTADYSVMNGHNRMVTPEYKLRRLQGLTTVHGMGLLYRFFELPPFKLYHAGKSPCSDMTLLDDYRCMEILFGNGAYLYMPRAPWRYVITECLLVGQLQRHYALQPVRDIHYLVDGDWRTLDDLVREGLMVNTTPFGEQTAAFARSRVRYANGLTIVVNRHAEAMPIQADDVALTLPQWGWAAWREGLLAYSAYYPGTEHRVDFLDDAASGTRYLDPRNKEILGVTLPTLWAKEGTNYRFVLEADPDKGAARSDTGTFRIVPEPKPPRERLHVRFAEGMQGWRPLAGVLRAEVITEGVRLGISDPDPQVWSPPLRIAGDAVKRVRLRLRIEEGSVGEKTVAQVYFKTAADPRISEDQVFRFSLDDTREWQAFEWNPRDHRLWRGQMITGIRLDPIHGVGKAVVVLGELDFAE